MDKSKRTAVFPRDAIPRAPIVSQVLGQFKRNRRKRTKKAALISVIIKMMMLIILMTRMGLRIIMMVVIVITCIGETIKVEVE